MEKTFHHYILLLLLITCFHSQLTEQERKNLLKKLIKRNNPNDFEKWNLFAKSNSNREEEQKYDPEKIKEIIKKYNFLETYNFIEDLNPPVIIKNQENCGCGWAFAAATALSYRYYKKGINIDLSPQYLLSCFSGDFESEGNILDTQFLLVKNGTVTETCMPFTSEEGISVEECPTKCKNDEEFIKYKSKNQYFTNFDYTDNYYDVVAIMMDQLINYGPMVAMITVYSDFYYLNEINCSNTIYKNDGFTIFGEDHAVVIVGYGYQDSKFYWLIQNSLGEDFCDKGFAKIEFGEVNIENVAFSEPYIEAEEDQEIKNISVKLSLREDCRFEYTAENEDDYDESFELYFKGPNETVNYQCNKFSFLNNTKGICYFGLGSYYNIEKGIYSYDYYKPLFKNNIIDIKFASDSDKNFSYYRYDTLFYLFEGVNNFYISEEGSSFMLVYNFFSFFPASKFISNIYINNDTNKKIKNCEAILNLNYYDYIFCNISQDEIEYFDNENKNISLTYDILCGKKETIPVFVHKLDKTKYPIFRAKYFILPDSKSINYQSELTLIVNIEGSISDYNNDISYFNSFIKIIKNNTTTDLDIYCEIPEVSEIQNNFAINCYCPIDSFYISYKYDEIFLLPYYYTSESQQPFEIIVKNSIKAITYLEYEKIISNNESVLTTENIHQTDNSPKSEEISQTNKEIKTDAESPTNTIEPPKPSVEDGRFIKLSLSFILVIIIIIS